MSIQEHEAQIIVEAAEPALANIFDAEADRVFKRICERMEQEPDMLQDELREAANGYKLDQGESPFILRSFLPAELSAIHIEYIYAKPIFNHAMGLPRIQADLLRELSVGMRLLTGRLIAPARSQVVSSYPGLKNRLSFEPVYPRKSSAAWKLANDVYQELREKNDTREVSLSSTKLLGAKIAMDLFMRTREASVAVCVNML